MCYVKYLEEEVGLHHQGPDSDGLTQDEEQQLQHNTAQHSTAPLDRGRTNHTHPNPKGEETRAGRGKGALCPSFVCDCLGPVTCFLRGDMRLRYLEKLLRGPIML